MKREAIVHPFPAFYRPDSRILILGSFPSVKSREQMFFYGHPRNRFWKVIAALYGEEEPPSVPDKRYFLERHRIALWDVIASCEITGSSDASVRNAVPVDVARVMHTAPIRRVVCNGALAAKLYRRHLQPITGIEAVTAPSTSPANAAWSPERLTEAWRALVTGTEGE